MDIKKGFVTVATGNEKYYQLAANLLMSYRKRGSGSYPFAIVCDRENEYTAEFDDVVTVQDIRKSTVDKLLMRHSPYEESIFIDADTLVLENIDDLWSIFENEDDVSVFGCVLPLDSQKGWFTYEGSGRYKPQIRYLLSMNGGIYYFRRSDRSARIFDKAIEIIDDYSTIDFKYFSEPQDEPIMAMSMVLNECKPCTADYDMIILPACEKRVYADWKGSVFEGRSVSRAKLIHFATPRTTLFLYNYLDAANKNGPAWCGRKNFLRMKLKYARSDMKFNLMHLGGKLLRGLKLEKLIDKLKKVLN